MQIFINELPILITSFADRPYFKEFDIMIDAQRQPIQLDNLMGKVIILASEAEEIKKCLVELEQKKQSKIDEIVIVTDKKKEIKKSLKSYFTIIKAAGGVVESDNKYLLIYRKGKWDLPKGKVEDKEDIAEAAIREIEEECNVKADIIKKIATTWHNYRQNNKVYLKRTTWYLMQTANINQAKPQTEEDIEQVVFFDKANAQKLLQKSYQSIRYVIEKLH